MEIIIGASVSILVQLIKKYLDSTTEKLIAVVMISLVAGTIYYLLAPSQYWYSFIEILGFAGAFYTYIIRRFEEKDQQ